MDFSDALRALKAGKKVTNTGWSVGVFISMSPGNKRTPAASIWSRHNHAHALARDGHVVEVLPAITQVLADGAIMMGWIPSQDDLFNECFVVIE